MMEILGRAAVGMIIILAWGSFQLFRGRWR